MSCKYVYASHISERFLLARLHMDALIQKHNVTEVRKALENLPKDVDETYNEALERIEQQNEADRVLARRVLSWVTHARRTLTVPELQHALAVVHGTNALDPDNITDEEILTSICAGLLVVDEERMIRLVRK
jgi:hypothetical protein